ncbi:MAG: response regulator, partial [Candidatus Methanofastidiosia archaeon]
MVSILIVEDEQIVAQDIHTRLTRMGYTVCGVASSGKEAVQLAKDGNPDLVLMDIVLKG